jgi:hypothetical protein
MTSVTQPSDGESYRVTEQLVSVGFRISREVDDLAKFNSFNGLRVTRRRQKTVDKFLGDSDFLAVPESTVLRNAQRILQDCPTVNT